jgi:hypothetical protein
VRLRTISWHGRNDADFFFNDIAGAGLRLEIDLPDIFADDRNREGLERGDEKEKQQVQPWTV